MVKPFSLQGCGVVMGNETEYRTVERKNRAREAKTSVPIAPEKASDFSFGRYYITSKSKVKAK